MTKTEIETRIRELWWEKEMYISAMFRHSESEVNPVVVNKIKMEYKPQIKQLENEIKELEEQLKI